MYMYNVVFLDTYSTCERNTCPTVLFPSVPPSPSPLPLLPSPSLPPSLRRCYKGTLIGWTSGLCECKLHQCQFNY